MSMNVPTYKSVRAANLASVSRLPLAVGSPSGSMGGVKFGAAVRRGINANSNVAPAITQNASYGSTLARLDRLLKLSKKNAVTYAALTIGDYAGDIISDYILIALRSEGISGYDLPENMTFDGTHIYYRGYATPTYYPDGKVGPKSRERLQVKSVPDASDYHFYTTWTELSPYHNTYWHTYTLPAGALPEKMPDKKTPYYGPPMGEPIIDPDYPTSPAPWPNLMPRRRINRRNRVKYREMPTTKGRFNSFSVGPNDKFEVGHAAAQRPNKRTTDAKATGSVGKILAFMGAALDWTTETMEVLEILYDHARIPKYYDMRTRTELYFLYGGWKRVDDWDALYMDLIKNYLTDKYIYGRFFGAVSKSARKNNLTGYNPLTHMPV